EMKKAMMFCVPFVLALAISAAKADDKAPAAGAKGEWTATIGCADCDFSKDTGAEHCGAAAKIGDKVFVLKGGSVTKDFKKGGQYVVKGTVSADGKSIEVTEMSKKA